jgi:hypothetical protein
MSRPHLNGCADLDLPEILSLRPHPTRGDRKMHKLRESVARQWTGGIEESGVTTKVHKLLRLAKSTPATDDRLEEEAFTWPPPETDVPTLEEARAIRDEIRATNAAMTRYFRGIAASVRTGVPPAPSQHETAEERLRYSDGSLA